MKRDMELVRKVLFELEKQPYTMGWVELGIPGHTPEDVSYHVLLLAEAGLIEAEDASTFAGPDWRAKRLTWTGHEFLDASRDEGRWRKAMETAARKGGGLTFDVLKELLIQLMRASVLGG